MHILALLVAAVFSSQFVAPNKIAAFTVTPKTITPAELEATPAFTTTLANTVTDVVGYFALTADAALEDGVAIAANKVNRDGAFNVIDPGFNLDTDLEIDPLPASIFIFLKDASEGYESVEVPVADEWEIEAPAPLKDIHLTKLPELTITPTTHQGGWSDAMEAKFSFTRGENAPVTVSHPIIRSGAGTGESPYLYKIEAGKSLAGLGILTKDFDNDGTTVDVTLTVSLVLDDDTEYPLTANLVIAREVPDFTVPTAPLLETAMVGATTSILITPPSSGTTWATKTVKAVFTLVKTAPTDLTTGIVAEGAAGAQPADAWTFTPNLSGLPLTDETVELYVWINVEGLTPAWNVAPGTIGITLEDPKPAATVALGKTSIAFADLGATGDITVELTGTNPTINANGKYKISYGTGDNERSVTGPLVTYTPPVFRANTITHKIASTDISGIGIPNEAVNAVVTIYPTGTRNAVTPKNLPITVSAVEFTVDPTTLTAVPTTIATLTVTPNDDTAWAAAGISVMLKSGANEKEINITADTPPAANAGSGRTYTATNIALTGWTGLDDGSVIAVHAAKTQSETPNYLPVTASITIDLPDPEPTNFTIPATTVKFADVFKVPKLEVTPDTELDWEALVTDGLLTYRYTIDDPESNDPAAELTGALTKTGSGETLAFFLPEQDLADFELTDALLPKTLIVEISEDGGDSYLDCTEEITLAKADAPTAKFAISPASVKEGALAKADSPAFNITIVDGVTPPAKEDEAKVIFTAGTKTLEVEFVPGGTTAAPTWVIAAAECDFASLNITTFPVTGSVKFFPEKDGDAFGPAIPFTFEAKDKPEAAMGVSPLLSLLAALVFLFVKLF